MTRSSRVELVAVASRSAAKAKLFCEELGLKDCVCLEGYEALLDADIDAVYLPLPTTLHLEWVRFFAAAGKHVLVEKPVGTTVAEVRAMIGICREKGVKIMDGTMFMHHERFASMSRLFQDELFWKPTRVTAAFSFYGGPEFLNKGNIRTRLDGDPCGCMGDVGWYCLRLGLAAFRYEKAVAVSTRLHDQSDEGVPFDLDCDVFFENDKMLSLHCSFKHHMRQWFEAVSVDPRFGSRIVRCDDFVIPRREEICDYTIEEIPNQQTINYDTVCASSKTTIPFYGCSQEKNMFDAFATLSPESSRFFEEVTIKTHYLMEAALLSAKNNGEKTNVTYFDD